jgi:PilZ domain-containing protein
MNRERRRHLRSRIEAPLRVWSIASGSRHACRGECVNLTEAGAGAIITGPWLPGQVVTMELVLPGADEITVQARLCHYNPTYYGFEFLGANHELRERLRSFCAVA